MAQQEPYELDEFPPIEDIVIAAQRTGKKYTVSDVCGCCVIVIPGVETSIDIDLCEEHQADESFQGELKDALRGFISTPIQDEES